MRAINKKKVTTLTFNRPLEAQVRHVFEKSGSEMGPECWDIELQTQRLVTHVRCCLYARSCFF
jgi:hypothetical protein